MIFEQFSRRKRNFKGHSFWARGYYVTTVGLYEAKVRSLIYGFYSNVARGKREKNEQDELIPSIIEPDGSSGGYKRNWARLIQKIYEVDPLTCPKCSGKMKVISVIEDEDVIKKILQRRTSPQAPGTLGSELNLNSTFVKQPPRSFLQGPS
jgi:hypothetical protein